MVFSYLWTTLLVAKTIKISSIIGCHWSFYDMTTFLSKLVIVTSHNYICTLKPFCTCIYDFKSFLHGAIKDGNIYSHKNGWLGHKLQTHGLT